MTLALVSNDPTTSVQSTDTTSYTFDLPGSLQEGDWLLCIMGKNGTGDILPSDGWQPARNGGLSNGFALLNVFWRYVDSAYTGETTDTFTGSSENVATAVYHFRGGNLEFQPPRVSWDVGGSTTTSPDPPSHTSPYGNEEHIWVTGVFHSASGSTSAAPTNYTNLASTESGGSDGVGVAIAIRTLTAATEDPGSFTWGTARTPGMFTLAIPTTEPGLQESTSPLFVRRYSHYEPSDVDPVPVPLVDINGLGALILLSLDGVQTITTPSGWTLLGTETTGAGDRRLAVYYRTGDGTEGSTVDFALSGAAQAAAYVYVFDDVDFSNDPPTWTKGTGSGTTVDPPSHTFTESGWHAVIMGHIHDLGGPGDVVTYPTNYENIVWQESSDTVQVTIATATRFVNATSEDPGTYTIDPSRAQAVYTISILGGATAPPPDAPTNPAATTQSFSSIQVTWDDVSDETGYRVERSDDGSTGWTDVSGNLAADTTSYLDEGLDADTQYFYRVIAFNANGDSDPSSVVNDTTAAVLVGRW